MLTYKRRKTEGDRISELPDEILYLILSFLSMRDGVKTRVLSRRWRFLCSSSSNIHFNTLSVLGIDYPKHVEEIDRLPLYLGVREDATDEYYSNLSSTQTPKFLIGVDQFLQSYTNPKLDTLQVSFPLRNINDSASHVDHWISFALAMHASTISLNFSSFLQMLDLKLRCPPLDISYYNFPCHLLSTTHHLKHLHLKYCTFTPSPHYSKGFNSLTTLEINSVQFEPFQVHDILSTCLNLECLTLRDCCLIRGSLRIYGPMPHFKSLFLLDCLTFISDIELNSLEKLQTFEYMGDQMEFEFINLHALENLYLHFYNELGVGSQYAFSKLTNALPKLKNLSLAFNPLEVPIPQGMIPFKHLRRLEFSAHFPWDYDVLTVANILNASPALQKFHLYLRYYGGDGDYKYKSSRKLEVGAPHLQLEEVEICGFREFATEMELVRYLFKYCISLKLMTVNVVTKGYEGAGNWIQYERPCSSYPNREEVRDLLVRERLIPSVEIIVL